MMDASCSPSRARQLVAAPSLAQCLAQALQTAIALATHDADNTFPDGHADYIEVWPDHFQRVIERRRVFVKDTNDIRNVTLEERALNEGLRRDRNLKLS